MKTLYGKDGSAATRSCHPRHRIRKFPPLPPPCAPPSPGPAMKRFQPCAACLQPCAFTVLSRVLCGPLGSFRSGALALQRPRQAREAGFAAVQLVLLGQAQAQV